MRSTFVLILGAFLVAGITSGCAMEEDYSELTDEQIESELHEVWVIGTNVQTRQWSSGNTSNLSSWQQATCAATYGTNYLITRFQAWREPTSNLDNFIARLKARCSEFEAFGSYYMHQNGNYADDLVYSGNYDGSRTGTTELGYTTNMPIGVKLSVDSGNNYAKDITLIYGFFATSNGTYYINGYGNQSTTGWALDNGNHNDTRTLLCPDQYVVAGVAARYSTNNGKMRNFKIYCRPASDV